MNRIRLHDDSYLVIICHDDDEQKELVKRLTMVVSDSVNTSVEDYWTGSRFITVPTVVIDIPDRDTARDIASFIAERFGEGVGIKDLPST